MTSRTVLVIAPAHPAVAAGEAQAAAYQQFRALKGSARVERVAFLAGYDAAVTGLITLFAEDEYLWRTMVGDPFQLRSALRESVTGVFRSFLEELQPDVVLVHHDRRLGTETLREIRRTCPGARIVLTLHDFAAICHNGGQMVKTGSHAPCFEAGLAACAACFPDRSEEAFWLRRHFIRKHFEAVDRFVAPSEFLRQRYVAWGLPVDRIAVIRTGEAPIQRLPPEPLPAGGRRNRFAFFGDLSPANGLDVLLAAVAALPRQQREEISLEVHGGGLEAQPDAFRARIESLRDPLMAEGVLSWLPPCPDEDLARRFARIDWVVVPSVTWGNTPRIARLALGFGRPLLCSDIGGLAEDVRHGQDGLHVAAGHAGRWGEALHAAATDADLFDRLQRSMRIPSPVWVATKAYMAWALEFRPPEADGAVHQISFDA